MKKLIVLIVVSLAIGTAYAADNTATAAKSTAKAEAPAFTTEQQAQIKTWNDRMVYINQAREKAITDLVQLENEKAAIIRQYQAMKPAKGAKPAGKIEPAAKGKQ